jgi:hypothetical protein
MVIRLVLGLALILVAIAGWVTGQIRPLAGAGFALIGVGLAWRGVGGLRARRTGR